MRCSISAEDNAAIRRKVETGESHDGLHVTHLHGHDVPGRHAIPEGGSLRPGWVSMAMIEMFRVEKST